MKHTLKDHKGIDVTVEKISLNPEIHKIVQNEQIFKCSYEDCNESFQKQHALTRIGIGNPYITIIFVSTNGVYTYYS
jgi:D-ribose pyranose/furanose isomerase RbsD